MTELKQEALEKAKQIVADYGFDTALLEGAIAAALSAALPAGDVEPVAGDLVERLQREAGPVRMNNGSFSDLAYEAAAAIIALQGKRDSLALSAIAEEKAKTRALGRAEAAEAEVARLKSGWQALDDAISSAIKPNDEPHRVFRDGRLIMEGEAAELYHNHLMLLRRLARSFRDGQKTGEPVCDGADAPEERCPKHPDDCTCWQVDLDHPAARDGQKTGEGYPAPEEFREACRARPQQARRLHRRELPDE